MITSTGIIDIWLKRNSLGLHSVGSLCKLISETKYLRTLDLENTELGDEGVTQLFTSLKGKPYSLKNIFPNANGIG